jgi:DNA end-binding protein Ku
MPARAIWSGTIAFGMVSIPVRLYSATESHDVRFHLLHKSDGARLRSLRWCPVDQREVPWDEVERGFEYTKGKYVPVSEEELDRLPVSTIHSVEISDFVKLEEVDPIYYERAYYLAPEENGAKAFSLLRRALEETHRAAVAKVALREKERLCLVRPFRGILALETMLYANEVRTTTELESADRQRPTVSSKELQMAVSLIDNLSDAFNIERYRDEYQGALKKLLAAKLKGKPLPQAPKERGAEVVDLMEALRKSVEATRKKGARATVSKPAIGRSRRAAG